MSNTQYSKPPSPESNPFAELFSILTKTDLSVEARLLYAILKLMAWSKGVCWAGMKKQAEYMGRSPDSIRRYHEELEKFKVLLVDRVPGRVNHYYPGSLSHHSNQAPPRTDASPSPCTGAVLTLKEERTNTLNVGTPTTKVPPLTEEPVSQQINVNAFQNFFPEESPSPPSAQYSESPSQPQAPYPSHSIPKSPPAINPDPDYLVEAIVETTNDHHSKGAWYRISREVPEQSIYQALSITREKISLESGVNPGRYFLGTLKSLTGFSFHTTRSCSVPPSLAAVMDTDRPTYPLPHKDHRTSLPSTATTTATQESPESQEKDPTLLVKGWKMLYKPGNVSSVLNVLQRCLSGCDVQGIWETLKQERPEEKEPLVLDEFLDLMAFKVTMGGTHS